MVNESTMTGELERQIDAGDADAKREAIRRGYHPESCQMRKRCEAMAEGGRLEYWSDGRNRAVVVRTNPEKVDRLADFDLIAFGGPAVGRSAWVEHTTRYGIE